MIVRDPRATFRHDEFLALLAQPSRVRFSAFEHAPPEERRQRFRDALHSAHVPLTFTESGINVRIEIATSTTSANNSQMEFESAAFVFSGVWVRLKGTLDCNELEGQARLEQAEPLDTADIPALTTDQLSTLRNLGLPV